MRLATRKNRAARGGVPIQTVLVVLTFTLVTGLSATPTATAQVPNLECLNCAVEISVLEWNGTGAPGTIVGGTVRIENTGESTDSYTITVNASDPAWTAEAETDNTGDVAPGAGLLAEDENTFDLAVNVLIPDDAGAGAEAGVTITATSDNDDTVSATTSTVATAAQRFGWRLDCTPNVTIEKTDSGVISLDAANTGNGPDGAVIRAVGGINGLQIDDPEAITASAGQNVTQDLDVGVGISLEDGDYTLRWNLTSTKSQSTHVTCATTIEVTGGAPKADDDAGKESEDSPAVSVVLPLLATIAFAARARRRDGSK